eukprot:COSAG04_NODE_5_length_50521_cov_24.772639_18_plen_143_part_00
MPSGLLCEDHLRIFCFLWESLVVLVFGLAYQVCVRRRRSRSRLGECSSSESASSGAAATVCALCAAELGAAPKSLTPPPNNKVLKPTAAAGEPELRVVAGCSVDERMDTMDCSSVPVVAGQIVQAGKGGAGEALVLDDRVTR